MDGTVNARLQAASSMAFTEINRLAAIKTKDGKEGIQAAAKQFESLFIDLVLKGMREANKAFSEGNYLSSFETELHQEMLDHQWAVHLAEHGGVGLADVIVRQLSGNEARPKEPDAGTLPSAWNVAAPLETMPERGAHAGDAAHKFDTAAAAIAGPTTDPAITEPVTAPAEFPLAVRTSGSKDDQFEGPIDFVKRLLPAVRDALAHTPLSPLAVLAQAALETGWGRQVIHAANGRSTHNLFGVKAGNDWKGDSVAVTTVEFRGGRPTTETARFRAYDSWGDALNDYLDVVTGAERYSAAVEHGQVPERYAKELQDAGYATDPDYATKIRRVLASEAMNVARELLHEILPPTRQFETSAASTSSGD